MNMKLMDIMKILWIYIHIYIITLNICGDILKIILQQIFNYINELEGAELSIADTDVEEDDDWLE